jgi:NAD(P)-dependent dehydrogenase (short-subunit alcohol dehydrogenase family)
MSEWTGVKGKRVVITGATSGIGLAAAQELARRGAHLAIVARSQSRAREAVELIRAAAPTGAAVDVLLADLASQASVRELAAAVQSRYPSVGLLINNAGAYNAVRQVSPDGIEMTWAVNHLAPFLLTTLLIDRLTASAPARVITTSSAAHKGRLIPFDDLNAQRSYAARGFRRYGETKLANILFTVELAERLRGSGVTANCFHPGFVATGFNRNNGAFNAVLMSLGRPFARSPRKGAETMVWLADSGEVTDETGAYFADMRRASPSRPAQDMQLARRLWEISREQTPVTSARG